MWGITLLMIAALTLPNTAYAAVEEIDEFVTVTDADEDGDEIIEEIIVQERPAKKKKKVRRIVRRRVRRKPAPRIIVVRDQRNDEAAEAEAAQQDAASAFAKPAAPLTFGQQVSQTIDTKLTADRKVREAKMAAEEQIRQDKLIQRLGAALAGSAEEDQAKLDAEKQAAADNALSDYKSEQAINEAKAAQEETFVTLGSQDQAMAEINSRSRSRSNGPSVTLAPSVGFAQMNNTNYDISSGTAMGISADMIVTDNLSVTFGYTYAQYDITLATNGFSYNYYNDYYSNRYNRNNYFYSYGNRNSSYYNYNSFEQTNSNLQKLEYNQNIIEAGIKYKLFDRTAVFRPMVGGGVGYIMGYLNYPKNSVRNNSNRFSTNNRFNNNFGSDPYYSGSGIYEDYEVNSFTGFVMAGAELNITESFGIGAIFKYHNILSTKSNFKINNNYFVRDGYNLAAMEEDKSGVGGTIEDSSFYTLGLSFNLSF